MFKKLIAVTAAFAAAATMSTAAFAATGTATATYNATDKTVDAEVQAGVTFSDQITVVITEVGAESITSENIYYIDQGGDVSVLSDMGMMESAIVEGKTYEVRVGCSEGDIYIGTFTVGSGAPSGYKKGDVDNSNEVNMIDVAAIMGHYLGVNLIESGTPAYDAADTNGDGDINMIDVSAAMGHYFGVELLWQ